MDTQAHSMSHAGHQGADGHAHAGHDHGVAGDAMVKDPVCGMSVALGAGKPSLEHAGTTYHFCSQKCHDKVAADPAYFLTEMHKKPAAAPAQWRGAKPDPCGPRGRAFQRANRRCRAKSGADHPVAGFLWRPVRQHANTATRRCLCSPIDFP